MITILLWLMIATMPFSGFSDERINEMFTPAEGETYLGNVIRVFEERPEMAQFVLGYPIYYGREVEANLENEVTKGEIPLFLQWDKRWGYTTYGSGFLAMTGCGPTSLSMVYSGLTGDTYLNPRRMAQMSEERGYYVPGVGTAWDLMTAGAKSLGLTVWGISLDGESIEEALQMEMPVICSMRPGDFTKGGHFIVLTGTDGQGNISVCDPNSTRNSEQTWRIERLIPQIKGLWAYRYDE